MTNNIISRLEEKGKNKLTKIIFPEATNSVILKAAEKAAKNKLIEPILVIQPEEFDELSNKLRINKNIFTVIINDEDTISKYAESFYKKNQLLSIKRLKRYFKNPLHFAAMLVNEGIAEGMVAGIEYSTADVLLACQIFVGLAENISSPSSIFLMDIPTFHGTEGNLIVIGDCAVIENPTSSQLADIAVSSAITANRLLDWEPRVALLSYSTKGSVQSESTVKIVEAVKKAMDKNPELIIDGEFQLDAAINQSIARNKIENPSQVAGNANILIVPDINSGNILYKGIQQFANAHAYGPLLQGFNKPVNDLSRGSTEEDVYGVIVITNILA